MKIFVIFQVMRRILNILTWQTAILSLGQGELRSERHITHLFISLADIKILAEEASARKESYLKDEPVEEAHHEFDELTDPGKIDVYENFID